MPELLAPDGWCDRYGLFIADPDGWRDADAPSWDTPLTLAEFWRRFTASTVRGNYADSYGRIMADLAKVEPDA